MARRFFYLHLLIVYLVVFALSSTGWSAAPEQRFPPPDLGEGFEYPADQDFTDTEIIDERTGQPIVGTGDYDTKPGWHQWVDVGVLFIALCAATLMVLKWRSRKAIAWLSFFSLIYFGFYRLGCVCPIGSIGNVSQAVCDSSFPIQGYVLAFFMMPLVFALLFGRVFCSGVCPLGALQDLVHCKTVTVPGGLDRALRIFRYMYLGLAIVFAALGASYIICRYDPFVSFFRFSGRMHLLVWSVVILILSLFIGRPYCRYLCPYGAVLGFLSRFAYKRTTITPEECVQCALCADACPYGAIKEGTGEPGGESFEDADSSGDRYQRFYRSFAQTLIFMIAGAAIGWFSGPALSNMHPVVQQAEKLHAFETNQPDVIPFEVEAFRIAGVPRDMLFNDAREIRDDFKLGGLLFGVFAGLVIGFALGSARLDRMEEDYEADPALCVSCGRCYMSCPVEHRRLGLLGRIKAARGMKSAKEEG